MHSPPLWSLTIQFLQRPQQRKKALKLGIQYVQKILRRVMTSNCQSVVEPQSGRIFKEAQLDLGLT
jgi:hypothetical protein